MDSGRMLTCLAVASIAGAAGASERPVRMRDLPAPVQKTILEQTRDAKLLGLAEEVEHGKTFYEAETEVAGRTRDVLIDPEGQVVEVEEEVALESIPAAASEAIRRAAGKRRIRKVERITRGATTLYEAHIRKLLRTVEVLVTADGAVRKE